MKCDRERSQIANYRSALKRLRAKLHALERARRDAAFREAYQSNKSDIAFGRQIRSYVLSPNALVKDQRTGVETADVAAVLNGDLDAFIEASLFAEAERRAARERGSTR